MTPKFFENQNAPSTPGITPRPEKPTGDPRSAEPPTSATSLSANPVSVRRGSTSKRGPIAPCASLVPRLMPSSTSKIGSALNPTFTSRFEKRVR